MTWKRRDERTNGRARGCPADIRARGDGALMVGEVAGHRVLQSQLLFLRRWRRSSSGWAGVLLLRLAREPRHAWINSSTCALSIGAIPFRAVHHVTVVINHESSSFVLTHHTARRPPRPYSRPSRPAPQRGAMTRIWSVAMNDDQLVPDLQVLVRPSTGNSDERDPRRCRWRRFGPARACPAQEAQAEAGGPDCADRRSANIPDIIA
jgi:hypothetical protein